MTEKKRSPEVGKPIAASELLNFKLPPVSKQQADFIGDPEPPTPADHSTPADSVGAPEDYYQGAPDSSDQSTRQSNPEREQAEQHRGRLSRDGVAYDPDLHQYPPTETKTGKWRNKSKAQREKWAKLEGTETGDDSPPRDRGAEIRIAAQNVAMLYGNSHQFLWGKGGEIKDPDELLPLISALEQKFQQDGMVDMPPTLSVLINAAFYTTRVAGRDENKEKTRGILAVVKGWGVAFLHYTGLKKKRPQQSAEKDTPEPEQYEPLNSIGGQ